MTTNQATDVLRLFGGVFHLQAYVVEAPYVDGARVYPLDLGHYSSLEKAQEWLRSGAIEEEFDPEDPDEILLYIHCWELTLDAGPRRVATFRVLSEQGDILCFRGAGFDEAPWLGREPATCRWARGDFVGCVRGETYRVGIVLGPPLSFDEAKRFGRFATGMDDSYFVGFPEEFDSAHPLESELCTPLAPVPDELQTALDERFRNYSHAKLPSALYRSE